MMSFRAVAVAGLLLATSAVAGEQDPKAIAAYRHTTFEALGKHMKASSMIVKGEVKGHVSDLYGHAHALHEVATYLTTMFPEGSGPGNGNPDTDALPAIWTDWAGFEAAAKKFEEETAKLEALAKAKDLEGFKAQFKAVGQACGNCHDSFRKDD